VERFIPLPSGQRHEAPKTGTVGTVAAERRRLRLLDAALNAISELDGGRHIAHPHAGRTTEGPVNPMVNRRGDFSLRDDARHGRSEFDASRTSATFAPPRSSDDSNVQLSDTL
jgi:hypothetical protein